MTDSHLHSGAAQQAPKGGHHGWMMMVCCIPMLALAILLVATGAIGASFMLYAVGCTAMMALMMRGMNHGDGGMNHGGGSMDHDLGAPPRRNPRRDK